MLRCNPGGQRRLIPLHSVPPGHTLVRMMRPCSKTGIFRTLRFFHGRHNQPRVLSQQRQLLWMPPCAGESTGVFGVGPLFELPPFARRDSQQFGGDHRQNRSGQHLHKVKACLLDDHLVPIRAICIRPCGLPPRLLPMGRLSFSIRIDTSLHKGVCSGASRNSILKCSSPIFSHRPREAVPFAALRKPWAYWRLRKSIWTSAKRRQYQPRRFILHRLCARWR